MATKKPVLLDLTKEELIAVIRDIYESTDISSDEFGNKTKKFLCSLNNIMHFERKEVDKQKSILRKAGLKKLTLDEKKALGIEKYGY